MHLTQFRVRKFRNIVDSGDIEVDPEVTCLVGMNESGKTAILTALHRLNPIGSSTFSSHRDYPRWLKTKDGKSGELQRTIVVKGVFTLDKSELAELSEHFGDGVLKEPTVTVSRRYDDTTLLWSLETDEAPALRKVLNGFDLSKSAVKVLGELTTFAELREALSAADDESAEECKAISAAIAAMVGDGTLDEALFRRVEGDIPWFFYFSDYSTLPGRIDVAELSGDEETASSAKQTARALLALADTTPDALAGDDYEDRRAELESVSNALTEQVFEYWKQNPHLRVTFDVDRQIEAQPNGYPGRRKVYLDVRVEDTRHRFTNNFSQRSSGFRWFFSFLAAFSEFESRDDGLVILLDEPGVSLHGRAQADFLRFINERLAPAAPVIYTTHSPFMVETDRIERVRIIEDKGPKEGAVVSQEVLTVGTDSLFPLQAALGYDVAQHLFIGKNNLVVEGPSDFLYLDALSRRLGGEDRKQLDEHVRVLPAGGASNIPAFVALIGRALDVTVLIDSGTEGAGKLETALSAGRIPERRLIQVGEIVGNKHADVEDLFAVDEYLSLYNAAFGTTVAESDLPPGDRIIYRLQKLRGEKFDHYRPAEQLLRDPTALDGLGQTTLDNFEKLIVRINETLT